MNYFVLVADVEPRITALAPPKDGIVRDINIPVEFNISLTHKFGAAIPEVTGVNQNFDVNLFATDKNYLFDASANIFNDVTFDLKQTTSLQMGINESGVLVVLMTIDVFIPQDVCPNVQILCLNVTLSAGAGYVEKNVANDIYCMNWTAYTSCTPGMVTKHLQIFCVQ